MVLTQLGVWMLTLPRVEPPDDIVHAAVQPIRRAVPGWPALGDITDQHLFERVIAKQQDPVHVWHSLHPSAGSGFPAAAATQLNPAPSP